MSGAEFIVVLGLAASVLQCIDAGKKALKKLREYQDGVFLCQDTIIQLEGLVGLLEKIPLDPTGAEGGVSEDNNLTKLVRGCQRHIEKLDRIIKKAAPVRTDSKLKRWTKGAKLLWKNGEIVQWQRALGEYKGSLSLWFSSATYMHISKGQGAEQDRGDRHELTAGDTTTYFDIPNKLTTQFVERVSLLDELARLALRHQDSPNPRITTVLGMGGQGKTQLVLKYCHSAKVGGHYRGIFWVNAFSQTTIVSSFERIAGFVNVDSARESPKTGDEKADFVRRHLSSWKSPWLLVFDGLDHADLFRDLNNFIPQNANGSVIITSRHNLASVQFAPQSTIRLNGMTDDEALELLLMRSLKIKADDTEYTGRDIVKRLGHHPLAIDQAAAYVGTKQLPLSRFLEQYEIRKQDVLKYAPGLGNYSQHTNQQNIALNAYTTWDMSFQQLGIGEERRAILSFLSTLAFMSPSRISEHILSQATISQDHVGDSIPQVLDLFISNGKWDSIKYEDMLMNLLSLSLIQKIDYGNSDLCFSMHPLIVDRLRCTEDASQSAFQAVLVVANTIESCGTMDCWVQGTVANLSDPQHRELLAQMEGCLHNIKPFEKCWTDEQKHTLMICKFYFAEYYRILYRYEQSEKLFRSTLPIPVEDVDFNDASLLIFTRFWCALRFCQNYHLEAERGWLSALSHLRDTLGPAHPQTLGTHLMLVSLYDGRNSFDELERHCQILCDSVGDSNTTLAYMSFHALGTVYLATSRPKDAIPALERSLAVAVTVFGDPGNTWATNVRCDLARSFYEAGQTSKSETVWREGVDIYKRTNGQNPNVLYGLGKIYADLGPDWGNEEDSKEAKRNLELAIEGFRDDDGWSHENTTRAQRALDKITKWEEEGAECAKSSHSQDQ